MFHGSKLVQKAKMGAACTLPVVCSGITAITAYASETGAADSLTDTATTALTTAVTSMSNGIASAISSVIPIAVPLVGASLVVTIGLKVFKTIVQKA